MNKDAFYFSHDCNARNDVKILKLRRILGTQGYGLYWMLIEVLRESKEYKLPLSAIKELSFDFRESEEIILSIVKDFSLFEVDDEYFFFSESLNRRMLKLDAKRMALSEAGKRGRQKQIQLAISNESTATPGPPPGSKVNKSKEKESKEDNILPWRKDFEIYKDGLREVHMSLLKDSEWMEKQEKYNPGVDIKLTLEKACVNFWATQAGWKHKKKQRSKEIDWKSTLTNSLSQSINRAYKIR